MGQTQSATHEKPLDSFAINLHSIRLTDRQFEQVCRDNPELRLELTAEGELIVMPPTGSKTGLRNSAINHQIRQWAIRDSRGLTFDSSTGFTLPSGAKRSPDAAWVRKERWDALDEQDQEGFAPLCPELVVELRSPRDNLDPLERKMQEYMRNGAELGWLIDPTEKRVYVYRPGADVVCLENPKSVDGEPVLTGFVLDLDEIW